MTKIKFKQTQDSTRVISGAGVSINANTAKFDIQIVGEIVSPTTEAVIDISINLTAQTTTYIAAQPESYVWVDSTNTVIQSLTPPSPMLFDTIIGYWVLVHSNLTTINVINSFPLYAEGNFVKLAQLLSFIGFAKFPGTNIASAGTTSTRISHTGGNAIKLGLGNTTKRPVASLSGGTDSTIEMRHRNGVNTSGIQDVDVTNYNPTGSTVSALGNNKFSACKVWKFASSLVRVQYGQYEYSNFNEALAHFDKDSYVDEGNASRNGMHIGWIIFKKGTTWSGGTSGVDYLFVDVTNGKSSSSLTPTLQASYDVSTEPEITTNATRGSLMIQRGSAADTDKVLEVRNGSSVSTWSVDGNGKVVPRVTTITSSSTPTPSADTDDEYIITALAAAPTFGAPTGTPSEGQIIIIRIKDNGTARALLFNAIYRFSGDQPAPTTTIINKTMYIMAIYNATGPFWDCMWRDNY